MTCLVVTAWCMTILHSSDERGANLDHVHYSKAG